jgi:hypothetical protein
MVTQIVLSRFIVLISLLCCFQIQQGLSDQISITDWYHNRMVETVVPSYRRAYTTLNVYIVEKLLTADTESDEATIKILVYSLLSAARNVQNDWRKATKASKYIRETIGDQIAQLLLLISTQEKQVHRSKNAVNQSNVNIQNAKHQVSIAEAAVHDSERSLHSADREWDAAHENLERQRLCGFGRRKKRFFILIKELLVKPFCSIFNSNGINNAKERRTMAQYTFQNTRERLNTHQQTLKTQQEQYQEAQKQLDADNAHLQTITSELSEKREKQSIITSLEEKFMNVEVHLNTVFGSSTLLQDELTQLLDFELVIEPLNAIYSELLQNNIMESFGFEISAAKAYQIKENLRKLTEKLPQMPLNTADSQHNFTAGKHDNDDIV